VRLVLSSRLGSDIDDERQIFSKRAGRNEHVVVVIEDQLERRRNFSGVRVLETGMSLMPDC